MVRAAPSEHWEWLLREVVVYDFMVHLVISGRFINWAVQFNLSINIFVRFTNGIL